PQRVSRRPHGQASVWRRELRRAVRAGPDRGGHRAGVDLHDHLPKDWRHEWRGAVNEQFSLSAFIVFLIFVGFVLALSFYLGRRAKSAGGYFAAHGQVNWFVNGIAFAGDYLSAASFLGICGMIAFYGYDGFLYSIGFLAGWVVALFVIAEPIKRLGRFTFADALNAKFNSRG